MSLKEKDKGTVRDIECDGGKIYRWKEGEIEADTAQRETDVER